MANTGKVTSFDWGAFNSLLDDERSTQRTARDNQDREDINHLNEEMGNLEKQSTDIAAKRALADLGPEAYRAVYGEDPPENLYDNEQFTIDDELKKRREDQTQFWTSGPSWMQDFSVHNRQVDEREDPWNKLNETLGIVETKAKKTQTDAEQALTQAQGDIDARQPDIEQRVQQRLQQKADVEYKWALDAWEKKVQEALQARLAEYGEEGRDYSNPKVVTGSKYKREGVNEVPGLSHAEATSGLYGYVAPVDGDIVAEGPNGEMIWIKRGDIEKNVGPKPTKQKVQFAADNEEHMALFKKLKQEEAARKYREALNQFGGVGDNDPNLWVGPNGPTPKQQAQPSYWSF